VAPDFLVFKRPAVVIGGIGASFGVDDHKWSSKLQEFAICATALQPARRALREGRGTFNLFGRQLGRGDQDLTMDGGTAASPVVDVYDETPHTYAFGARSLYSGGGTDTLTIATAFDATFRTLRASPMRRGSSTAMSAGCAALDEALRRHEIAAIHARGDLSVRRKGSYSNEFA